MRMSGWPSIVSLTVAYWPAEDQKPNDNQWWTSTTRSISSMVPSPSSAPRSRVLR